MARTVTWEELRNLAAFTARSGCAVSLYLNLDPSVAPTAGDAATRLNSLLDEVARSDGVSRAALNSPDPGRPWARSLAIRVAARLTPMVRLA